MCMVVPRLIVQPSVGSPDLAALLIVLEDQAGQVSSANEFTCNGVPRGEEESVSITDFSINTTYSHTPPPPPHHRLPHWASATVFTSICVYVLFCLHPQTLICNCLFFGAQRGALHRAGSLFGRESRSVEVRGAQGWAIC